MKRSKMERLESEKNARRTRDFINGSGEIYKNRFKGGRRKQLNGGKIHSIDENLLETAEEVYED